MIKYSFMLFIVSLAGFSSTFESLVQKIELKKIESMEVAIKELVKISPELKENFALVYDSRSPVEASLEYPRVIVANYTGEFTAAWGGKKGMRKADQLEMIEYDSKEERNVFRVIDFSGEKVKVVRDAGKNCIGCHGTKGDLSSMKHIWDMYPSWPGVYGSAHNTSPVWPTNSRGLKIPQFEVRALKKFLKEYKANDRYSALNIEKNTNYGHFFRRHIDNFWQTNIPTEEINFEIFYDALVHNNSLFDGIFGGHNLKRVRRKILNSPVSAQFYKVFSNRDLFQAFKIKVQREGINTPFRDGYREKRQSAKVRDVSRIYRKYGESTTNIHVADIHIDGTPMAVLKEMGLSYKNISTEFYRNSFGFRGNFVTPLFRDEQGQVTGAWKDELGNENKHIGYTTRGSALTMDPQYSKLSIFDEKRALPQELRRLLTYCKSKQDFVDLITIRKEFANAYSDSEKEEIYLFFSENKGVYKFLKGTAPNGLKGRLNNKYFTEQDYDFLLKSN